jgi:predicted ester cyclase
VSENLKVLGEYSAAMFSGDTEAVFDFWAPEFVSHVTRRVAPERVGDDVRGDEQIWWNQVMASFPDMDFRVDLLIESDDLIVSNWTVVGTFTGAPFFDLPPTGEPIEINGTAILRMRDGKIVEHWGGPHCQRGLGLIV